VAARPSLLRLALLGGALAAGAAASGDGCFGPAPATPAAACATALTDAFLDAALAQRDTLEHCFGDPSAAKVEGCVSADPLARVGPALAQTLAAEARACAGELPALGTAGGAAANEAALGAGLALAHGLFGRDLDAARVDPAGDPDSAACQTAVLDRAGDCSGRFLAAYERCAARALAGGADDPFDLVACKARDPRGFVAQVCDAGIAAAVASACAGLDPAALFPGCAGDLAACARAHARRSASAALNTAAGLCQGVLAGSLPEDVLLACFEPPAQEPLAFSDVPLPEGVSPGSVEWDEAGQALWIGFTAPDVTGTQLASVGADGSGFRCLTCGSAISGNLRPVQIFRDGRRVLVAGPNNPNPRWRVLECTPSLADCQSSVLLPIQLPDSADAVLQYRVPHVTFDDAWFIWTEVRARGPGGVLSAMGRLERDASAYVVRDARVIAPPIRSLDLGTDSDVWRSFTQPFEAKEAAMRGGLDWVQAGTPGAGHYDDLVIELATGAVRRLTRHPDHDEGIRFSRDEQWAVLSSARTSERTEFLGLLPRPPYIDWIAFSTHFVAIAGAPGDGLSPGGNPDERDCYNDPWLLDRWFERGDYIGQRLLRPEDGWESSAGGFAWSPDGTRLALLDRRWKRLLAPGEPQPGRLRIATLTRREPIDPAAVVALVPTPEPTWAVRYEDWIVPDTFGETVIPGKVSGTATLRNAMPSSIEGSIEVEFAGYSDDGRTTLDGVESLRIPSIILQGAEYAVDLALSGEHTGSMRGSVFYDFEADVNTGEVVSELDGRVLRGPRTCYDAGLIPIP
jgi:hypothetical protein